MNILIQKKCRACLGDVHKHSAAQREICSQKKLEMVKNGVLKSESYAEVYKKMPANIGRATALHTRSYSE